MLTMHSKTGKRFTINLFTILAALAVLTLAVLTAQPAAAAPPEKEMVCDDGIDNDNDGKIDCADPNCNKDPVCGDGSSGGEITPATITFDDNAAGIRSDGSGPYVHMDPEDVGLDVFIGSAANDGNIILRPNDGLRDLNITIPLDDQCGLTTGLIDLELLKVDVDDAVSGGIYGIAPDDFANVPMKIRFDVGGTLYFLNFNNDQSGPCKNKSGLVRVERATNGASWTVSDDGAACVERNKRGKNDLCFGGEAMNFSFTLVEN